MLLSHCTLFYMGVSLEKGSYLKSLNVNMILSALLLSLGLLLVCSNLMVDSLEDHLGVY